ncbi:hypothetical protein Sbs19_20200 [Sphingobium sp. BS19]|nr:hypothetical protein Sbs19_20200 [Sphingobium sp. BS19]
MDDGWSGRIVTNRMAEDIFCVGPGANILMAGVAPYLSPAVPFCEIGDSRKDMRGGKMRVAA